MNILRHLSILHTSVWHHIVGFPKENEELKMKCKQTLLSIKFCQRSSKISLDCRDFSLIRMDLYWKCPLQWGRETLTVTFKSAYWLNALFLEFKGQTIGVQLGLLSVLPWTFWTSPLGYDLHTSNSFNLTSHACIRSCTQNHPHWALHTFQGEKKTSGWKW